MGMKIKVLIFTVLLLSAGPFALDHPLKMSFSNLTISSDGNLELETHIFLDDITAHMKKLYGLQQVDFSNTTSNGIQALQRYFEDTLYFEQDGKKIKLYIHTVSFSKNQIALEVIMNTAKPLEIAKDIYLVNTILCDASPRQLNSVKYLDENYKFNIGAPKVIIPIK